MGKFAPIVASSIPALVTPIHAIVPAIYAIILTIIAALPAIATTVNAALMTVGRSGAGREKRASRANGKGEQKHFCYSIHVMRPDDCFHGM